MAERPWEEVKEKFNAALSLRSQQRADYLAQLATESTELHHEVADLLAKHDDADDDEFLASLKIGKQTEADLQETIALGLPTIDMKEAAENPNSLVTMSTTVAVNDIDYIGEIGDYQLIEQIGRGGMGVVYKAHQKKVGRTVALKVIASGSLCAPEDIARFHDEATAAGRLSHPGIVAVYDAGEHDGTHYFSMAYIEGDSLASFVGRDKPRLDPRRAAKLMAQVCRAVQYAHDRAVIHRDIKPANIMLDKSGQPLLTDFGLAKLVGNEGLTMTGQVMGTPNYMAPEQAKGQQDLISNRTDVYSLGATLYALLSGMPAFVGKNLMETLRKVESAAPEPLTFKGSPVALDLWTICEKSLAKRPDDRYESAAALADDLERFLQGFPISARAVGPLTRLQRWCQRNPVIATLIGTVAATLVVATIVSIGFAIQARAEQARAETAQARAEKNLALIEDILENVLVSMSESDLADVPGTQFIREKLLLTAQGYYQKLSSTEQATEGMIARAAFPLGRLQASLGRFDDAKESFDNVLAFQEKIAKAYPKDLAAVEKLGQTHYEYAKLGERIWNKRNTLNPNEEAKNGLALFVQHAAQGVDWRQKAYELEPQNIESGRLLANAKMGLALGKIEQQFAEPQPHLLKEAEQLLNEAQTLRKKLLEEDSQAGKVQADLAKGFIAIADLRVEEAREVESTDPTEYESLNQDSMDFRNQAIEIYENLPPEANTKDTQYELATCYQALAKGFAKAEDYDKAIDYYDKMATTLNPCLLGNPGIFKFRKGVADAQYSLAQLFFILGDPVGLELVNEFQITLANALIVDSNDQDAVNLMITYTDDIVAILANDEYITEAVKCWEQARDLLEEAGVSDANSAFMKGILKQINDKIEKLQPSNQDDRTT